MEFDRRRKKTIIVCREFIIWPLGFPFSAEGKLRAKYLNNNHKKIIWNEFRFGFRNKNGPLWKVERKQITVIADAQNHGWMMQLHTDLLLINP